MKENYACFNPDREYKQTEAQTPAGQKQQAEQLAAGFSSLLEKANYRQLSEQDLQQSFRAASLIPLQTSVDFDDFDQVLFYSRGAGQKTVTIKRLLRKKELRIDNFERVAVLLRFRDLSHFESKQKRLDELGFVPGKTYLYLYKNIPRNDLELLFPNVEVRMNWKDRLLLMVPAIGAAVPLVLKVLPSLGLLVAAILLVTMGPELTEKFGFKADGSTNIYPLLAAVLSIGATLGGFAVRQYSKYKNKRLKFLKTVTDTLFFKNLVTNEGVLYSLTDAAEEELCKEVILVYYHLLTADKILNRQQLDEKIERWMQDNFGVTVDFDIDKTLQSLTQLTDDQQRSLLSVQQDDRLQVLPLSEAKHLLDYIWDNAFTYANPPQQQ